MKSTGSISEKGNMERLDLEENPTSQKIPYPKGVFFLMATELSERFSYYGMRAVLTIYMRNVLSFSENLATSYYHIFLMLCYGLPIVWGVISDSWLGKFRTILYVSILFALGNMVLTLSSVPPLHLPSTTFFFVGLFLMAIGTAGMKPCVAPLGGEQFVMPQQSKQLTQFFSAFFFAVTIGNMVSTVITPIFRRDVACFGNENCYPLAFGVPSAIMVLAIVIFICGRPLYKVNKPNGNMLVKVTKCVAHALSNRGKKSAEVDSHWLDKASDLYDQEIIKDTKGLFRVLPYFIPVPMFFALYEQLGSRWTLQATRMKGSIGSFSIKPDQMQVSNAILMFISLPLFNWAVYPLIAKFGINFRTLTKMVIGGLLAAMSFGVAGLVELKIEPAIKSRPSGQNTVVTLINSVPCPVKVWINNTDAPSYYDVESNEFLELSPFKYENGTFVRVEPVGANCLYNRTWEGEVDLLPRQYQSISISPLHDHSLSVRAFPFWDDYAKSKDGNARIRFIFESNQSINQENHVHSNSKDLENITITLNPVDEGTIHSFNLVPNDGIFYTETEEVDEDVYKVSLNFSNGVSDISTKIELLNGGSYNLIVVRNPTNNQLQSQLVIITPPNDVHILWLVPQYVLMAWGEILFIVSGMEFAYTEAPPSMKSVVQAIWHLMNACGNLIVIIAVQNHGQGSQAIEFFIFAGCMFVDSIVYGFMARRYKYVSHDAAPVAMH